MNVCKENSLLNPAWGIVASLALPIVVIVVCACLGR